MLFMFMHVFGEYENVINVYQDTFIQQFEEQRVHDPLKRGRGVTKPKWHDSKLKLSIPGYKRGFLCITWVHGDLMVPITQV